jgi:stage IV sporulation protein FB
MFGRRSSMDNPINWSLSLGRIAGIRVRIHLLFILFVGFELLSAARTPYFRFVAFGYLALFGIVFLHEMGHCFAARSVGGYAHDILMWPLGGLATVHAPQRPDAQLITTVGGPAVNVALCILCALVLVAATGTGSAVSWNPANPWAGGPHLTAGWQFYVTQFFYFNYILLLFNLLPMYPLDGGRLLQEVLWMRVGYLRSLLIATRVGMIGAIIVGVYALWAQWWIVIGIAIFAYITCMQQQQMARFYLAEYGAGFAGYEPAAGYGTLDQSFEQPAERPSFWERRRQKRAARRRRRIEEQRRMEEEELDAILEKVRQQGLQSLSRREKRVLESATARRRDQVR